ncbi:hypothetical protein UFOVP817_28 [uncultured Caudovirales phage]|uniref:Uncharacterized protein n=1 Tax=uncultured Caudovirales phage TaxID=2100421 RepID=A0A6J5P6I1_9CAUD|nr:hypothetical protein UFOVP817_28 [uncultured Caudovirales phage]
METYPYPTPEGIIDLVRKSEFDRLKWELEELRSDLTRWQALAGQMATAICEAPYDEPLAEALAAYESAIATTGTQGTAQ